MRPDDILRFLNHRPFQSFRFHVLETTAYEVRHPELVILGRSVLTLDLANPTDPISSIGRRVTIALLHITRIEPIGSPINPLGNGG